jgi:hypothetical protein
MSDKEKADAALSIDVGAFWCSEDGRGLRIALGGFVIAGLGLLVAFVGYVLLGVALGFLAGLISVCGLGVHAAIVMKKRAR